MERWRLKARLNYRYGEGDVEWNPKNTLRYPAVCFFAGFFAGLFGVGGGIVKGPLMLEMGERGVLGGVLGSGSREGRGGGGGEAGRFCAKESGVSWCGCAAGCMYVYLRVVKVVRGRALPCLALATGGEGVPWIELATL